MSLEASFDGPFVIIVLFVDNRFIEDCLKTSKYSMFGLSDTLLSEFISLVL